jgi:Zinc carboxypeptidase.
MQPLSFLPDSFAEYEDLRTILDQGSASFEIRTVYETTVRGRQFAVHTASIGSTDPLAPAIGFFGGIHGLERIGSQLVLDYMRALLARLEWDELLVRQLQSIRLIFMPIVNPAACGRHAGQSQWSRSDAQCAAECADERVPLLAGGQRVGAWLPWYRGRQGEPMEPEAAALLRVVETEMAGRPLSIALDCHSGTAGAIASGFPTRARAS